MVRQATDTAVRASISTPVWPVTLTVERTRRPGSVRSGSMSTAILETGRGWQSGISSWVRLAAMMPATRAAPSTSPFLALPLSTRSSVAFAITTRPSAVATRSVAAFADTSTMRASPPAPRWVSLRARATCLLRGAEAALAAQQRAGGGLDVALAHQAFADQEGGDADRGQMVEVIRRGDAAFADRDAAFWNLRRQQLADRYLGLEGLEIAVVDADQPRPAVQRPLELALVMDFEQHVHAERLGGVLEVLRQAVVDRRH